MGEVIPPGGEANADAGTPKSAPGERRLTYLAGFEMGLTYARIAAADALGAQHPDMPALQAALSPEMDDAFADAVASGDAP